ncbi:hypothetical protein SDC9_202120 [bioreactor metagenome]|uniref:Uncharacterized protein n=1 Tax=bioreactor metagenome TaxID=1076179 RepID=A0A645IU81_9ZZZZ
MAYCIKNEGHEVLFALGALAYGFEAIPDFDIVPVFFHCAKFLYLVYSNACVDFKEFALRHVFFYLELVDSDDDAVSGLDRLLVLVGGILDILLRIAFFNSGHHSAHFIDLVDVFPCSFFYLLGE